MVGGHALTKSELTFFEPRFAHDFRAVRLHEDRDSTRVLNARAYTLGRHIVFSPDEYTRGESSRWHLLAHELTHVVQQGAARAKSSNAIVRRGVSPAFGNAYLQRVPRPRGQEATSGRGRLTSDLTSPITLGSTVRFEVNYPSRASKYLWRITNRGNGSVELQSVIRAPTFEVPATKLGNFRISVVGIIERPSLQGMPPLTTYLDELHVDQQVVAEDPALASLLPSGGEGSAVRELVNDFRGYVEASARHTGVQGITALFLASILRIEIANTSVTGFTRPKVARQSELEDVYAELGRLRRGRRVDFADINRSIGVGQLRQSTVAMLEGATPWIEQNISNRSFARRRIDRNYENLPAGQLAELYDMLRWPRSNISIAADLLSRLKNRAHRFPGLTRARFGLDQNAVEITATEYNLGGSNTPLASARPNWYGRQVWAHMSDPVMIRYFSNT